MDDYSVRAWTALNYLVPTFFPERKSKPKIEMRVCRGMDCIGAAPHLLETMWTGCKNTGGKVYFCNSCQKRYTGKIELWRVVNE